jgi:hypothetical protein
MPSFSVRAQIDFSPTRKKAGGAEDTKGFCGAAIDGCEIFCAMQHRSKIV